jgi:hypothetical protein
MRLGAMQVGRRSLPDAIRSLERAETLTRDPYVIFLARYFKGQALERQRQPERAEAAYRGAVAAVPKAQSATLALAVLVLRNCSRAEAQRLVRDMLAADPPPPIHGAPASTPTIASGRSSSAGCERRSCTRSQSEP